ncbi:unnamed protein product (macronuclear) [Paramecium tetraurelia]|uniref:Uncharacterized protein n=1 Tax=Paramecium tetraurelia TaxID=5888 RepID=A0DTD7_PARTE|nr:uncharacterized protein GSPATT00039760001 [Paramecium tetraurelia]CAK86304.1 unnamed protein product [Paramecium tetraurelia]
MNLITLICKINFIPISFNRKRNATIERILPQTKCLIV